MSYGGSRKRQARGHPGPRTSRVSFIGVYSKKEDSLCGLVVRRRIVLGASIPVVDLSSFSASAPDARARVSVEIGEACRESGFFYVVGHGIDDAVQTRLEDLSREFFAQDLDAKLSIRMELGG